MTQSPDDRSARARRQSNIPSMDLNNRSNINGPSSALQREQLSRSVSFAINEASGSASNAPDADLIAKITAAVVQQLSQNNVVPPPANPTSPTLPNLPRKPPTPEKERDDPTNANPQVPLNMDADTTARRRPSSPTPRPTQSQQPRGQSRPDYTRIPTEDATTLEKIWQPLFENDGRATKRLGQFLRGLALHIIDDYTPKKSLVISPQKLLRFYEEVKMEDEDYPWAEIFASKELSYIYQELACEHHFVQAEVNEKPSVPSLTPNGFECLMTLVIQAHPDVEYERFSKAVLNMPISNADDTKERFPKELSRRLFPRNSHLPSRMLVEDVIYSSAGITRMRDYAQETSQETEKTRRQDIPQEAERLRCRESVHASKSNTSSVPSSSKSSNTGGDSVNAPIGSTNTTTNEMPIPIPIERERKPYVAQPGGGKVYESSDKPPQRSNTTSTTSDKYRPTKSVEQPADEFSVPQRYRSGSVAATQGPPRRHRSPSAHQQPQYARSDTTLPSTGSTYPSNSGPNDDNLRRYTSNQGRYDPAAYEPEDYTSNTRSRYDHPPPPPPSYR